MTDVAVMAKSVTTIMRRKKTRHVLFLADIGFMLIKESRIKVSHYDAFNFVGVYPPTVSRSRIEVDLLFNGECYGASA